MNGTGLVILIYLALAAGCLAVIYYLIKLAVFNAIVEAHAKIQSTEHGDLP